LIYTIKIHIFILTHNTLAIFFSIISPFSPIINQKTSADVFAQSDDRGYGHPAVCGSFTFAKRKGECGRKTSGMHVSQQVSIGVCYGLGVYLSNYKFFCQI
jgi:hypothetical protein